MERLEGLSSEKNENHFVFSTADEGPTVSTTTLHQTSSSSLFSTHRTLCDHSTKVVTTLSKPRLEAMSQLAIRRAAIVASASLQSKINQYTNFDEECVRLVTQKIELDSCLLESQLIFLDKLNEMNRQEKVDSIFDLFDKDASGFVDVQELAEGLRKLNKLRALNEMIALADQTISEFDNRVDDGMLDKEEFGSFLDTLSFTIRCDFDDLAYLMVMRIAFTENGTSILENAIGNLVASKKCQVTSIETFNDALNEARMNIVFHMLDLERTGYLNFGFVVKHVFRFSQGMEGLKRHVLLAIDPNHHRTMNYEQFSELMLNLIASFPNYVDFHDIANSMTLSLARADVTDEDMKELFITNIVFEDANTSDSVQQAISHDFLENGRLHRLFDLIDLDHNGVIDTGELTTALRKFHQTSMDLMITIDEAIASIDRFDRNHDGSLNKHEFASMLMFFAGAAEVSVHELIDFMVVQVALKDEDLKDQAYIHSLFSLKTSRRSIAKGKDFSIKRGNILSMLQHMTSGTDVKTKAALSA